MEAAVIGVGYLGQFHAEKYASSELAELVAVVDEDRARAEEVAQALGVQALTDYRQLPELGVECASVVTPTTTHFEIASWLLENGIHTLVEKPVTDRLDHAQQLIEIAKRNERTLRVGHLERFNPAFRAMKQVLTNPMFFEARRIAPFSGRAFDVDVMTDLMIHDVDIIAHLVGRPLERIEAVGVPVLTDSVDIANARLTFEGNIIANITASRAALASERSIRVFQPDVYLSLNFEKKKLKVYERTTELDSKGFRRIRVEEQHVEERDALAHEIEAFLKAIHEGRPPEVPGEDGLRALELVTQIRDAIEENLSARAQIPEAIADLAANERSG